MSTLIDEKKFALNAGTPLYSQTSLLDERIKYVVSNDDDELDNTFSPHRVAEKYEILIPTQYLKEAPASKNAKQMSPRSVSHSPLGPGSTSVSSSSSSSSQMIDRLKAIKAKQALNNGSAGTSKACVNNGDSGKKGNLNGQQILFAAEKITLEWKRKGNFSHPPGLRNNGNTCFLNSVLQSLTYCAPLVNYLLSMESHIKSCNKNFCTLCMMIEHIVAAHSGSKQVINPVTFTSRLQGFQRHFHRNEQQDAHEFLSALRDLLVRDTIHQHRIELKLAKTQIIDVKTARTTAIGQIFGGFYRNHIQCTSCNHSSYSYDYFLDTMLDINKVSTLEEGLQKFIKPETLFGDNAYKCEKCKKMTTARKQYQFHEVPNVFTIHLKRFNNHGMKLQHQIAYPNILDLRPYMSNKQGPSIQYKLFSVLIHQGHSTSFGHYFCYTKAPNESWYQMNDESVTHSSFNTALNQKNAYVLFYTQIKKPSVPQSIPPNPSVVLGNREVPERPVISKPTPPQQEQNDNKDFNTTFDLFESSVKKDLNNLKSKCSPANTVPQVKKNKKNKKRKRKSRDLSDKVTWVEKTQETIKSQESKNGTNPVGNGFLSKASIKKWNGTESQLTESPTNGKHSKRDHDDEDDEYNQEFDRGKSKKVKSSVKNCFRFNQLPYNFLLSHNSLYKN